MEQRILAGKFWPNEWTTSRGDPEYSGWKKLKRTSLFKFQPTLNKLSLTRVSHNSLRLTNPWSSSSQSNWNLEMLIFVEGGTPENLEKTRTNNKLNPLMTPGPGFEPGPLTSAPALLPISVIFGIMESTFWLAFHCTAIMYCINSIPKCIAWYVNRQVRFFQGKYGILHTCPADDWEKKNQYGSCN